MEASKTIRHQIGPNGESGKKMEWVTPKISPLEAVETQGKNTNASESTFTDPVTGGATQYGPS